MTSLGKGYERLNKIPKELGIQSALPAPIPEPSQSSGRKRKHMELEPEIKVHGLECSRSPPKGVPFVNNMIRNVESTIDITELFRKLNFICHWANPFKDFERSNVPEFKLSSFSESNDTFTSLQALSNLHYLFSGFMDYFWSRELNISNFSPSNR
ncbi:hypothetical protein Tco_0709213 [Tanacetum coccineum]